MSDFTAELISATTSMIDRVGVDLRTPAAGMDTDIWAQLGDAGFTTLSVPEEAGGGGAPLADALTVVSVAAERGALTPLIEHGVLAGWLAASAGHTLTSGTTTVALGRSSCTVRTDRDAALLDGTVTEVPFAADADAIVLLLSPAPGTTSSTIAVASLTAPGVTISADTDLTGASLADVTFNATPVIFHGRSPVAADQFVRRGALSYAAATAAAARAVMDQTVRHASERTQFGRPLTKFQAIQQRLASSAALTTMMDIAVSEATALSDTEHSRSAIAAAKAVTSMSAATVAAAAHQIHGAIGTTTEHRLGRFTTSLWSWRDRHGSEQFWADELAMLALDGGIDVWDLVVGTDSLHNGSTHSDTDRSRA